MTGLGSRLAEARQQKGLSLADAERQTRITRRYLEALETDRFHLLPAPVYARGFLRNYARFLGLNADELLAQMPADEPQPSNLPARTGGSSINLWTVAGLALGLGIVLWAVIALKVYQGVNDAGGALLDSFRDEPSQLTPVATQPAPVVQPVFDCDTLQNRSSLTDEESAWFEENCAAPEPTETPVPYRTTCEEIRGTEYQSGEERTFFLANCLTPPAG